MRRASVGYKFGMKIGVIGSDSRAVAIAQLLLGGGHDVTIGDPRHVEAAERAAADLGGVRENPYHQAITREVLVFAFPRSDSDRIIASMGEPPTGVIVDARDGGPAVAHHGAELLAHKFDSHEVVRALILLPQPGANIPICGDDPDAKALVEEAFAACGCTTTDRGPLSNAAELEPPDASSAA